jgi:hypothetical protein
LADGPPLIRGFANPAEPNRSCRKLHARDTLVGIILQGIDIYIIFIDLDFGIKLSRLGDD